MPCNSYTTETKPQDSFTRNLLSLKFSVVTKHFVFMVQRLSGWSWTSYHLLKSCRCGLLEPIPATASSGWRRVISRTSHQFIAALHKTNNHSHSHSTPTANLEFPIRLTCRSLKCGRKPERLERTHADTKRHANSTQKGLRPWDWTCNLLAVRRQCWPLHRRGRRLRHVRIIKSRAWLKRVCKASLQTFCLTDKSFSSLMMERWHKHWNWCHYTGSYMVKLIYQRGEICVTSVERTPHVAYLAL